MTAILHQLRSRSRALAHGLLLVLLATWLAAVCPHCLAEAAETPETVPAAHCHGEAPPPAEVPAAGHDCCTPSPECAGAGCAQLSGVTSVEPPAFVASEPGTQLPYAFAAIGDAYPAMPPPFPPIAQQVAVDPCPLYLRHCSLLN
jgi:hypothetical protein